MSQTWYKVRPILHEIVVYRGFNDDIDHIKDLLRLVVTDMTLTHPPLTYVRSRSGQGQVSDLW